MEKQSVIVWRPGDFSYRGRTAGKTIYSFVIVCLTCACPTFAVGGFIFIFVRKDNVIYLHKKIKCLLLMRLWSKM